MAFVGADGSQSDQLEQFLWEDVQINYQYDANGNITQITDGKGKIQYTYDTRNQLIREDREADRQTITYAYDKNGNLLRKNQYEYQPEVAMETLASATPSETKIYRYEGNWKDQLTSYNGETIAYDAMGNPTVYRGMEMGWKNSSELTEIEKDQTTIRYRYDKEGMRNRKYLSDGTTVLYQVQDGQIIGEQHLREDQEKPLYEMTFSYDADGTLFSMNCDGKDYYYILNPTGDVIALVDTGWNTVVSYAYDSWGNVTAIEGNQDLGKKNPLRYRGYYWDEETGLYYLASRYYDPEVGRFISIDDTSALGIKPEDIDGCNLGCLGIPEFGTDFVIQMVQDANPQSLSDLIRISGLSHGTNVWLGNAQVLIESGKATISTAICTRDDIMIYLINQGVDSALSFTIMESVRKGKGLKPEWEEAMKEKDVPDWYIWSCKQISYMFPKAHAAAYVMMAYRIAYCKINYPLAYYGAYFGIRANAFSYELMCQGKDKLNYYMKDYKRRSDSLSNKEQDVLKDMKIVQEMYARGYEFLPLDIYKAKATKFQIIDGKLMPPLSSIEGMGEKAAEAVEEAAKDGPYLSLDDFRQRTKVSKTVIEFMSDLGLFGNLPHSNQLSLFDF